DAFTGELTVHNVGDAPLVVSRLAVRGDGIEPWAPASTSVHLVERALPATLAPGERAEAIVTFTPDTTRIKQLFTHVLVVTSDEAEGTVVVGVRAQVPGPLGPLDPYVLSLLIGFPLAGAALRWILEARRRALSRWVSMA